MTESNLIPFPEYREIIAQLKHIAAKGEPLPTVVPKLITMYEAAQMLGISLANFKKQLPEGEYDFELRCWNSMGNRFERYAVPSGLTAEPIILA